MLFATSLHDHQQLKILKGHTQAVQSLSWLPVNLASEHPQSLPATPMQTPSAPGMSTAPLLSGAKDKFVRVWNCFDGTAQAWEMSANKSKKGMNDSSYLGNKVWTSVCWLDSTHVLSSSVGCVLSFYVSL